MNMLLLAIWLILVFAGGAAFWAHRQAKLTRELSQKVAAAEQRSDQLAGYVQRALEDIYVLSVLMAERGHLEPDEVERSRERLIKKAKTNRDSQQAARVEAP